MIKLVIFDLWNTLCHKKYRKGSTKHLWKELGQKHEPRKILKTFEEVFQLDESKDFEEKYRKMFKKLSIKANEEVIKRYANERKKLERNCINYVYTVPLLKKLKQKGYKIALLSNTTKIGGDLILKSEAGKYIDKCFFPYETGYLKPAKKAFKKVLDHFKVKPSEVIMIGDSRLDDYESSKKLGMHALLLTKDRQPIGDLKKMGVL